MQAVEIRQAVEEVFGTLMNERGTPITEFDQTRPLYDGGYGLDSMDTATFSAMLAERFDSDPYALGVFPQNIAEIVIFYTNAPVKP